MLNFRTLEEVVGLESSSAKSDSHGGILVAVVSLSCKEQLVLKRLDVAHTGTWIPYLIPENICLESQPDILLCLAGGIIDQTLFPCEYKEKKCMKHIHVFQWFGREFSNSKNMTAI